MQVQPLYGHSADVSSRLLMPVLGTVVLGLAVAVTFVGGPVALAGWAAALLVLTFALRFVAALPILFLYVLALILIGYAFLGRTFAYLGVPPLYVGELAFGVGVIASITSGALPLLMRSPVIWVLLAFAVWGMSQTLPYLGTYGIDALRDAVLWGYGAFALMVAACVLGRGTIRAAESRIASAVQQYGRLTVWLVALLPVVLVLASLAGDFKPSIPFTEIPLFDMKAGDAGVHLAGAAVFALLGLHRSLIVSRRALVLFWASWAIAFLLVASLNRGGFLAVAVALAVAGTLNLATGRRIVIGGAIGLAAAAVVLVMSVTVQDSSELAAQSQDRTVSPRQVVENVLSIGGLGAGGNLSDTRNWRLDWWRSIVDYTIFGEYFWTGKGFGVNLADDDGFQVEFDAAPLRSPHNAHMSVLARMGVPGFLLWVMLQLAFAVALVLAYVRARGRGAEWWARINLWILCYWCAFLVNSSFDVFLEGPQGGIWFWCLIGFGVAALEVQRAELAAPPPRSATGRRA